MPYRDPRVGRHKDRERYHRRAAERRSAGLCPKCGKRAPAPDRSICPPCAGKARVAGRARDARLRAAGQPRRDKEKARAYERERERRQIAGRIARGICTKCGTNPAEPARRMCEHCAAHRCTDCNQPSHGASRCASCAKRSYERCEHVRGMPLYPPSYTIVNPATGEDLGTWDSWEEVAMCLAFERLDIDDVEVLVDQSPMASLTAWA